MNLKLSPAAQIISIVFLLFLFLPQPGHQTPVSPQFVPSSPAHIRRGDWVEKHYQNYSALLRRYYESLSVALKNSAPELLVLLRPSEPIQHGYQILPAILSIPPAEEPVRARSIGYSWPWTDHLIDKEWLEIVRYEAELRRAKMLRGSQSMLILQRLALNFRAMGERQRNIDAHVQYNRFWQAAIAADRAGYDRETALQNEVLERQGILEGLRNLDTAFGRFSVSLKQFQTPLGLAAIGNDLKRREALLAHRINDTTSRLRTPDFVALERHANDWIFRIPLYTDIEDQAFVASVKRIIESTWQLRDGTNSFRVELVISYVATDLLYGGSEKPMIGGRVDIRRHLRRFPSGAAILTTGAITTHVQDYAIVLGPHAITPNVLAHEFGHILGFRDRYIRGYRDLGENGFQVMEVVADPNDIMAVPATGSVLRSHFEMLLRSKLGLKTPIAPEHEILPARERSRA
jgi:hypothetical protein